VFVLRECFDFSYRDIAATIGKTEANCRQLDRRARRRLAEPKRTRRADPETHRRLVDSFMAAAQEGDLDRLLTLLAEDARSLSDGGGVVTAARRPVVGAISIARFIAGLSTKIPPGWSWEPALVNGEYGVLTRVGGTPHAVISFVVRDGRIAELYFQLNPAKLAAIPAR
jgi:RNA polymerase sigma-70 factor (ECF subfamily)